MIHEILENLWLISNNLNIDALSFLDFFYWKQKLENEEKKKNWE